LARSALPAGWRLRRRSDTPLWLGVLVRIAAVALALALVGVVLKLGGMDPLALGAKALRQSVGTAYGLQQALLLATPLILTGLAVAVGMKMRVWNIGADGQLYMGAFFATAVALHVQGPSPVMLVAIFLAGALGGMFLILVPALARAYLNVNEIISTLLLNFVAVLLVNYFAMGPWRDRGASILSATRKLPYEIPMLGGSYLHAGIIIAVAIALLLALAMQSTRWGYEVRIIGGSRRVAEFAGIPVLRHILVVMLLSGALAGVAGMIEVAGTAHRLAGTLSNSYGFMGIIVAALANASFVGIIPVGFLLAVLLNAGIVLQTSGLSVTAMAAINGVILIFAAVGEVAAGYRLERVRRGPGPAGEVQALQSECPDPIEEDHADALQPAGGTPGTEVWL
jgi:general nucleoside transport system permease protein